MLLWGAMTTEGKHKDPKGRRRRSLWGIGMGLALIPIVPACSSSITPKAGSTTTTAAVSPSAPEPVTLPQQSQASVAACAANAQSVEVALEAFMAERGAYPSPPLPWSAATYASNYEPLTAAADGGPFLHNAPNTASAVIEYDAAGHIWVEPAGIYGTTYNAGQDFGLNPDVCLAAVR